MRIALGLIHYPIQDRQGKVVATNVTNLDVHDIARASRVYGLDRYYIIHPMQDQWRVGEGAKMNPKRRTALTMVETAGSLDEAMCNWQKLLGSRERPLVVSTHARAIEGIPMVSYREMRERIELARREGGDRDVFLIFGTGFGLTEEFMRSCDLLLEPVRGAPPDDYRHLSVRSAVSIILDRLLGAW